MFLESKGELQSSTIKTAWVQIGAGLATLLAVFGVGLPEQVMETVTSILVPITMVVSGFLVRRGRKNATMSIK